MHVYHGLLASTSTCSKICGNFFSISVPLCFCSTLRDKRMFEPFLHFQFRRCQFWYHLVPFSVPVRYTVPVHVPQLVHVWCTLLAPFSSKHPQCSTRGVPSAPWQVHCLSFTPPSSWWVGSDAHLSFREILVVLLSTIFCGTAADI